MTFIAKAMVFSVAAHIVKRGFDAYDAWKLKRDVQKLHRHG
jgi:hypothetical protein